MKSVEVTLDGKVYQMPVNFNALDQVDQYAGDPLKMALVLANDGRLTAVQTIKVIIAGARCGGCTVDRTILGDWIRDKGVTEFMLIAANYVVDLSSGSPSVPLADAKKKQEEVADLSPVETSFATAIR